VADKELYIPSEALRLIDQEGSTNVPTVLLYQNGNVHVGYEALRTAAGQRALLNEDFKLDLGLSEARSQETRKNFLAADGNFKSADDLAADFVMDRRKNPPAAIGTRLCQAIQGNP
jgi:hypothetical protein